MSTVIKSKTFQTPLGLSADKAGVSVDFDNGIGGGYFDTAELLAAVATECDVIVIPRGDLPEVTRRRTGRLTAGGIEDMSTDTAEEHRQEALRLLALAEYLDAPVDSDVQYLADALKDIGVHDPLFVAANLIRHAGIQVTR